jgi:hypothetical protein
MNGGWAVPLERVHVVAPGDSVNVGDRELAAIKPVLFDNPMSVGIYDASSGALFWVDACGAILPRESKDAAEFSEDELRQGILAWESFDSPWVALAEGEKFVKLLGGVRTLAPELILSSHLPPARGMTDQLLDVADSYTKRNTPAD